MDDYQHPKPGKTYISPALPAFWDKERIVRIASNAILSTGGYEYAKERGEAVIRKKPDAATHIFSKFLVRSWSIPTWRSTECFATG